jgi:hypothetical protein
MVKLIDWRPFDKFPENTNTCRCGAVFRSHAKTVFDSDKKTFVLLSRKACPACGSRKDVIRSASDPEAMTLRGRR